MADMAAKIEQKIWTTLAFILRCVTGHRVNQRIQHSVSHFSSGFYRLLHEISWLKSQVTSFFRGGFESQLQQEKKELNQCTVSQHIHW